MSGNYLRVLRFIGYNEEFHLEGLLLLLKIHRKLKVNHYGEKLVQIHDLFWEVVHSVKYIVNLVTISSWSTMEKIHFVSSMIHI